MNTNQKRDLQFNLRLSEEDRAKLDTLAKAHNMNTANVLRMLIGQAVCPSPLAPQEMTVEQKQTALKHVAEGIRVADEVYCKPMSSETDDRLSLAICSLGRALFIMLGAPETLKECEECTCLTKPGALCPQCHRTVGR